MSAVRSQPATTGGLVLTPWMAGPVEPGDAEGTVSVTEYSAHHRRTLPGAAVNGLRMRLGWYAMPGAVGLWLWMLPTAGRGGSISVWAAEADLERVLKPAH